MNLTDFLRLVRDKCLAVTVGVGGIYVVGLLLHLIGFSGTMNLALLSLSSISCAFTVLVPVSRRVGA